MRPSSVVDVAVGAVDVASRARPGSPRGCARAGARRKRKTRDEEPRVGLGQRRPGSPGPGRPPRAGAPTSGSRASAIASASRASAASARWSSAWRMRSEERVRRLALEAAEERERREEVELVGAPVEVGERREAVRLDRLHQARGRSGPSSAVGAKWPSRTWRPGASRDLARPRPG